MGETVTADAWRQHDDLLRRYTKEWLVRPDLQVRALATERAVEFGLGELGEGKLTDLTGMLAWHFTTRRGNVSTMRELALTLWSACDFVDASNPKWAEHPSDLDPVESFEVRDDDEHVDLGQASEDGGDGA